MTVEEKEEEEEEGGGGCYTPLVKFGVQVGDAVVDAEDVLELGGKGAGNGAAKGGGQLWVSRLEG